MVPVLLCSLRMMERGEVKLLLVRKPRARSVELVMAPAAMLYAPPAELAANTPVPLVPAALPTELAPLFQSAVAAPATTRKPAGRLEVAVAFEVVPMELKSWVTIASRVAMLIWAHAVQGINHAKSSTANCRQSRVEFAFMWRMEGEG